MMWQITKQIIHVCVKRFKASSVDKFSCYLNNLSLISCEILDQDKFYFANTKPFQLKGMFFLKCIYALRRILYMCVQKTD